ncbi:MAG: DUF4301 family protein [Bacteroidota bacterium]
MNPFNAADLEQIKNKGISIEKVEDQIAIFKKGIPFVRLEKAAVVGDGILRLTNEEGKAACNYFDEVSAKQQLLKFVPASGAASRMFKALFNFLEAYDPDSEDFATYLDRTGDKALAAFQEGMTDFPFYKTVKARIGDDFDGEGPELKAFVNEVLSESGLNYGFYPKGLLPFHNYETESATPFKEHLKEAAAYAKSNGSAHLHFTISEQHDAMFQEEMASSGPQIEKTTDTTFQIGFSNQKPATDTIAVDPNNEPFRNGDGTLLFRPGGHGALIENLNEQEADIIFIKNIDNVVVDRNLDAVVESKKMLGGILLRVRDKAFGYVKALKEGTFQEDELVQFLKEELNVRLPKDFDSLSIEDKKETCRKALHRPIRICGMVKNEGEPGGGPFWINEQGKISLQIVESAQVDMSDASQASLLKNSTHFNPVDIVCSVMDHNGNKFDLLNFVNPEQGFITGKTKEGKELKALELPGLWNGAMAYWNTIFVEVPLVTFNPVKTVNDLLKTSHQV